MGRFLQADPSGFNGDASNLYRYCGNNPLMHSDPAGLGGPNRRMDGGGGWGEYYSGGDGTASAGWGTMGFDVSGYSGVTVQQAESAYAMASYATQQAMGGFAGFLGIAQNFGSIGLYNTVRFGTPAPRATFVAPPSGTVTVAPATVVRRAPAVGSGQVLIGPLEFEGPVQPVDPLVRFLSTPATPEEAAWTDTGRVPTEIGALIVLGVFVAPETGLYGMANAGLEYLSGHTSTVCALAAGASIVVEENPQAQQLLQHVPEWSPTEIQLTIQIQATVQNLPVPTGH